MSAIRKNYFLRLYFRIFVLFFCIFIYINHPQSFDILNGLNFFKSPSFFHLLWIIWIFDMFLQIIPVKNKIPLGSQKLFFNRFRPIREKISSKSLHKHIVSVSNAAYRVFLLWSLLICVIGALFFKNFIDKKILFLISVFFYVCDLICVLIWCPFRLIMKNKCCTTCRIFNWDHLMMFSPLIFAGGFYCISLLVFAFVVFLVWEMCVIIYPERFSEMTNASLKCSECTDKLCTQYCKKLR